MEREALEKELADLDRNISALDAEEQGQKTQIEAFESYKENIEQEES